MHSEGYRDVALSSERALELRNAEQLMKGIMIPPRPSILVDVLNEQSKADVDLDRVADLISKDVAISAGVLRVVNSSFFGVPRKISSIEHAVRMIGLRSVANIVTALMLHSAFSENKGRFMNAFWTSSGNLAAVTSFASRLLRAVAPEEGYALGLFANCGVPLMVRRFPSYAAVYEEAQHVEDVTVAAYEDGELNTDHTLVGYIMGKSWELPEVMCQCFLRHHDAVDYFSDGQDDIGGAAPYLAILHMGQHLYRTSQEIPPSLEWRTIGSAVCAYLDVTERELPDLEQEAASHLSEGTDVFGEV